MGFAKVENSGKLEMYELILDNVKTSRFDWCIKADQKYQISFFTRGCIHEFGENLYANNNCQSCVTGSSI